MAEFKNITVKYGSEVILDNVSLTVKENEITVLLGENASGKSTLLSCLTDIKKFKGSIEISGMDISRVKIRERAKLFSYLPQSLPSVSLSVYSLVAMGRSAYLDIGKALTDEDKKAINNALEFLDIVHLKDRNLLSLSGGERQKAYIATVLAQGADTMFFDEPSTFLDIRHERELMGIFKKLRDEQKKTLLIVMHNFESALDIADNIAILRKGKLVFCGRKRQCLDERAIERYFDVEKEEYTKNGVTRYLFR